MAAGWSVESPGYEPAPAKAGQAASSFSSLGLRAKITRELRRASVAYGRRKRREKGQVRSSLAPFKVALILDAPIARAWVIDQDFAGGNFGAGKERSLVQPCLFKQVDPPALKKGFVNPPPFPLPAFLG